MLCVLVASSPVHNIKLQREEFDALLAVAQAVGWPSKLTATSGKHVNTAWCMWPATGADTVAPLCQAGQVHGAYWQAHHMACSHTLRHLP